jgi:hypothetical protein
MVSTARIERPLLHRGGSASTETIPVVSPSPSQSARSGSTGPTWVSFPSLQARSFYLQGWGLIDLPLRATFSPSHPLARRDVPLARARASRDRALREHRRSSAAISSASRRFQKCQPRGILQPVVWQVVSATFCRDETPAGTKWTYLTKVALSSNVRKCRIIS